MTTEQTAQETTQAEQTEVQKNTADIMYPGDAQEKVEAKKETEVSKEESKETETQDLELVIPENSKLSQQDVESVKALAKEYGLTKDAAQKILDGKQSIKESYVSELQENAKKQADAWLNESKNDPEIGKSFNESITLAKRALDKFAPKELIEALDISGLGNHPGMVKFASRVGKFLADDKFESAPKSPAAPKSMEEIFYGKNN